MSDSPDLTERQQRVLDAALEVFADKGFHGASTAEIAKKAGVAEGTVFKTYKTKKELLIGVVAPLFAKTVAPVLIGEVRDIVRAPHASFEDFLRAIYTNRLGFLRAHERMAKIALQELPFHPEVRELAKKTIAKLLLPDAIATVKKFQERGEIRADAEPTQVVRLVAGTMGTFVLTRMFIAPEAAWNDAAEIELMVQTLVRGLKPATAAAKTSTTTTKVARKKKNGRS